MIHNAFGTVSIIYSHPQPRQEWGAGNVYIRPEGGEVEMGVVVVGGGGYIKQTRGEVTVTSVYPTPTELTQCQHVP